MKKIWQFLKTFIITFLSFFGISFIIGMIFSWFIPTFNYIDAIFMSLGIGIGNGIIRRPIFLSQSTKTKKPDKKSSDEWIIPVSNYYGDKVKAIPIDEAFDLFYKLNHPKIYKTDITDFIKIFFNYTRCDIRVDVQKYISIKQSLECFSSFCDMLNNSKYRIY